LVAALLRVAGVTAGLAESNGSNGFMTHVTCRLTAKNRDQLRNRTLGNRVWATFYIYDAPCADRGAARRRCIEYWNEEMQQVRRAWITKIRISMA